MCNMLEETPVNHCYAVKCDKCGKTTWKGCGAHVESVSLVSCTLEKYIVYTSGRSWQGSKRGTAASVGRILD
ncbi:hypothetical protein EDB84DRAFT_1463451, partial [Lactarius hengduanensis]